MISLTCICCWHIEGNTHENHFHINPHMDVYIRLYVCSLDDAYCRWQSKNWCSHGLFLLLLYNDTNKCMSDTTWPRTTLCYRMLQKLLTMSIASILLNASLVLSKQTIQLICMWNDKDSLECCERLRRIFRMENNRYMWNGIAVSEGVSS